MKYIYKNNNIYLSQPDFDLDETLDCGQAFRWEKTDKNTYKGFYLDTPLTISKEGENFCLLFPEFLPTFVCESFVTLV